MIRGVASYLFNCVMCMRRHDEDSSEFGVRSSVEKVDPSVGRKVPVPVHIPFFFLDPAPSGQRHPVAIVCRARLMADG